MPASQGWQVPLESPFWQPARKKPLAADGGREGGEVVAAVTGGGAGVGGQVGGREGGGGHGDRCSLG